VSAGVEISSCRGCGWQGLPRRLWCPACGGVGVHAVRVHEGTVAEATVLERAVGELAAPVPIGTVALDGGGAVVVRLEGSAAEGARVVLSSEDGAPVARPK
jgi:uncharacterized OB-fold protein